MILRAQRIDDKYSMAKIMVPGVDSNGDPITVEDWYTIPKERVHCIGVDGDHDIIRHIPDTPEIAERLRASAEYLADNDPHLMARHLRIARLCITALYGEPDIDGNRQSELLEDYITRGADPLEIVETTTAGDYFQPQ